MICQLAILPCISLFLVNVNGTPHIAELPHISLLKLKLADTSNDVPQMAATLTHKMANDVHQLLSSADLLADSTIDGRTSLRRSGLLSRQEVVSQVSVAEALSQLEGSMQSTSDSFREWAHNPDTEESRRLRTYRNVTNEALLARRALEAFKSRSMAVKLASMEQQAQELEDEVQEPIKLPMLKAAKVTDVDGAKVVKAVMPRKVVRAATVPRTEQQLVKVATKLPVKIMIPKVHMSLIKQFLSGKIGLGQNVLRVLRRLKHRMTKEQKAALRKMLLSPAQHSLKTPQERHKTAKLAQLMDSKLPVANAQPHDNKIVKSLKLKRSKPPVAHVQLHAALKGINLSELRFEPHLGLAVNFADMRTGLAALELSEQRLVRHWRRLDVVHVTQNIKDKVAHDLMHDAHERVSDVRETVGEATQNMQQYLSEPEPEVRHKIQRAHARKPAVTPSDPVADFDKKVAKITATFQKDAHTMSAPHKPEALFLAPTKAEVGHDLKLFLEPHQRSREEPSQPTQEDSVDLLSVAANEYLSEADTSQKAVKRTSPDHQQAHLQPAAASPAQMPRPLPATARPVRPVSPVAPSAPHANTHNSDKESAMNFFINPPKAQESHGRAKPEPKVNAALVGFRVASLTSTEVSSDSLVDPLAGFMYSHMH